MRLILLSALTTGIFCAAFAAVVDAITDALTMWQVIVIASISGFCGSLFASYCWGKGRRDP